jgi:hypothetical protein
VKKVLVSVLKLNQLQLHEKSGKGEGKNPALKASYNQLPQLK